MIEFIYIVWFYIVWVKIEIVLKLVLLGLSFWYVGSDNDVISYVFVGEFCFCLCLCDFCVYWLLYCIGM